MKKGLKLLKIVVIYVICEIGLAVLQGVLAMQLYHNGDIDYELMQNIIMFVCSFLQNSIHVLTISFVILVCLDIPITKAKYALMIEMCCSVVFSLFEVFISTKAQGNMEIQILEIIFWLVVAVSFLLGMKHVCKDRKK